MSSQGSPFDLKGRIAVVTGAGQYDVIAFAREHLVEIDRIAEESPLDELMLRRLKKRRLGLRDEMARIERALSPDEPA